MELEKTQLYKRLISEENIYKAIYSIESYVFEKDILEDSDKKLLIKLHDKFDFVLIENVIEKVKVKIAEIIKEDELFKASVYFRPKKLNDGNHEFRPLHTTNLINQIAIVAMLNILVYDYETNSKKLYLSNLSKLIPSNFYGNIPSLNSKYLFEPWQKMYKQYSVDISNTYATYSETGEYKYEVQLDLINFFPSVNPYMIYEYIIKTLSINYQDKECEMLKMIVFKLLYFEIENIENYKKYYYKFKSNTDYFSEQSLSVGILQGLPQSCFFGNLCMIKISDIFSKEFPGKSFYYVDDSVIFTKSIEDKDKTFSQKLERINSRIREIDYSLNRDYKFNISNYNGLDKIIRFTNAINYGIKVHPPQGKSEYSEIDGPQKGEYFLNSINREASLGAFDIISTFNEMEDITLKNKFKTLEESIDNEIKRINDLLLNDCDDINQFENYKKKLLRLKKFFKFRKRIIEYRENNTITENEIDELIKKLQITNKDNEIDELKLQEFLSYYNEDIFLTEYLFILKNVIDEKAYKKIKKATEKFDIALLGKNYNQVAYLSKIVAIEGKKITNEQDSYSSLEKIAKLKLPSYKKAHENLKLNKIEEYIKQINESKINIFSFIDRKEYLQIVLNNSDEIYRMILNAFFSKVFNVYLNDSMQISKIDNKLLTYSELRILVYLRNKNFSLENFIHYMVYHIQKFDSSKLDYSIYEALDYFLYFVKEPKLIDNIIQVHRYTSDIWKNGSKHLYFYTLHNQEHAIDLIKNSITFIKSIDYFQITKLDYYVLFISCYLHDISMVIYPDLNDFLKKDSFNSNIIYSQFRKELVSVRKKLFYIDSKEIKDLLLEYYKKVDKFFEEQVRNGHSKDSARFIRNSKDFTFLEPSIREIVAEISEAHGYDIRDIYKIKSYAKQSLVSKKFTKIILRVADLLDMSKDRVSKAILDNNISNMSNASQFHWLSHQLIEGYKIETIYENKTKSDNESYLRRKNIVEHIILTINVNFHQLTVVDSCNCGNISAFNDVKNDIIKVNLGEKCTNGDCNFICKWMKCKNYYLLLEFNAIQEYLSQNQNNYFDSKITIKIKMNKSGVLEPEYFDIIKGYI